MKLDTTTRDEKIHESSVSYWVDHLYKDGWRSWYCYSALHKAVEVRDHFKGIAFLADYDIGPGEHYTDVRVREVQTLVTIHD